MSHSVHIMTLLHTNHLLHLCPSHGCMLFLPWGLFIYLYIHQFNKFIIYAEWSTQVIDQKQWQNVGLYNMLSSLYSVTDAYVGSASIVHVFSCFLPATAVPQFLYVLIGHTISFAVIWLHWLIIEFYLSPSAWLGLPREHWCNFNCPGVHHTEITRGQIPSEL